MQTYHQIELFLISSMQSTIFIFARQWAYDPTDPQ